MLAELARRLRESAAPSLLDTPLDVLSESISDEAPRELLRALHASGEADALRDLLQGDRLPQWVGERCTESEEQALVDLMRRWLEDPASGPDDPARLVRLPAPPAARGALLAWAAQHDVERFLLRPARELMAAEQVGELTLLELCLGARAPARRASLLAEERARDHARMLVHHEARRNAARLARAELHRRPLPDGALGLLARRLRALCGRYSLDELEPCCFLPARPVAVEPETGVCHGAFAGAELPIRATLFLSGFEQRAVEATCSACDVAACVHVAALAARLLDACFRPEDGLYLRLSELARVPSWQRFVRALAPPEPPGGQEGRLAFVLRVEARRVSVAVYHQRPPGEGGRGRARLLSPHKAARSPLATERDRIVLAALAARVRTLGPQLVPADLAVLRSLVAHPFVLHEGSEALVRVTEESVQVAFVEEPEGLLPEVTLAGTPLARGAGDPADGYALHFDEAARSLVFAPVQPAVERLLRALRGFRGVLPPESYPSLAPLVAELELVAKVALPRALEGRSRPPPRRLLLRVTPLLDEGIDVALGVRALPLAPLWSPGHGPELVHGLDDGAPCVVRRDLDHERALAAEVSRALGLDEQLALGPFSRRLPETQAALELLARAARMSDVLEIEWAERKRRLSVSGTLRARDLKVAFFKRGDFCALEGGAVVDSETQIAIDRLLAAARTGERFVRIDGGDYLEIEQALFDRLRAAQLGLLPSARELGISSAALPMWRAQLGDGLEPGDQEAAAFLSEVERRDDPSDIALPEALAAELRPYQRDGARFLLQRARWAPGACLADEMGLGKTVQAIAVLVARRACGPMLVVAPTSVVDGWRAELARFAPSLRVRLYRGSRRSALLEELAAGDVVVTSYELLLRDVAHFSPLAFDTLVVDEAQLVKNARTLRARALAGVSAHFRIALSGTPVENRLGDLWSLFHLIAPGLLGGWSRFRARFAVPIERYENDARAAALRALVAPLVLRRKKLDVLSELPPRTEVVHLVELSRAERELYATALTEARRALGKRRRADDTARRAQILAELTRLRLLACHPRLVVEDTRVSSSKLALLEELLSDLLPRGHRLLVFSQFVRHLSLVREAVERRGASYLMLDGSTPADKRAELVARFQRGEAQLFLVSLKAGGTGLNLTAADYVIHMDPWWNPSVEDQASDRAHRLGQERPVTIVKLVAQGTIEERVLSLHAHKRRLAERVLGDAGPLDLTPDLDELARLLALA